MPIVSGNGLFIEDGGMSAIGTSPYEQGEEAGRMALAIALDKQRATDIPITEPKQFVVAMKGTLIKKRGFMLPRVYEAAASTCGNFRP